MSTGAALFSLSTTVCSSGVSMVSSADQMKAAPPSLTEASSDALTAAAFMGSPSWKVTPLRRWKVHVLASAEDSQRSARAGRKRSFEPGGFIHSSGS